MTRPAQTPLQSAILDYARTLPDGRTATYVEAAEAVGANRQTVRSAAERLARMGHAEALRIGRGALGRPHEPQSDWDVDHEPAEDVAAELTRRRDEVREVAERRPWRRAGGVVEMPAKVYRVTLTRGA
jgi:alkylated DNA nucleotide flippase Atl1